MNETFYSTSGSSPQQVEREKQKRIERMRPLAEAVTRCVDAVFRPVDGSAANEYMPEVECAECGARGFISILRMDSWERIKHAAFCRAGRQLENAVRISRFGCPSRTGTNHAIRDLNATTDRIGGAR